MKAVLSFLVLFLAFGKVSAVSNDNQANAEIISSNFCSANAQYSNVGATNDGSTVSCSSNHNNIWFKFQATSDYLKAIVKTGADEGTIRYPELTIRNIDGSLVDCINANGSSNDIFLETNVVSGSWYLLSIQNTYSSSSNEGTFTLCLNDQIPPNYKEGAINLTDSLNLPNWCSAGQIFSNEGYTADANLQSSCSDIYNDMWFTFTAKTSYLDVTLDSEGSSFDNETLLLTNDLGIEIACDSYISGLRIEVFDLNINSQYFLQVGNTSYSNSYEGVFGLCVNDQIPPDYKEGAINLTNSLEYSPWCSVVDGYTNVGRDRTGPEVSCITYDGLGYYDTWYKFNARTEFIRVDVITSDIQGSLSEPYLLIQDELGNEVACDVKGAGTLDLRAENFDLNIGSNYFISVGNRTANNSKSGFYTLCVSDQIPPDYKEGALLIESDLCSENGVYNNFDTNYYGTSTTCQDNVYGDTWFKFQAESSYININVLTDFVPVGEQTLDNIHIALFNEDGTEYDCGYVSTLTLESLNLNKGEVYYLAVGTNLFRNEGKFDLCLDDDVPYDIELLEIENQAISDIIEIDLNLSEVNSFDLELTEYPTDIELAYYISKYSTFDLESAIEVGRTSFFNDNSPEVEIYINKTIDQGLHYLFLEFDPSNQLEETNDDNNLVMIPVNISGPDFILEKTIGGVSKTSHDYTIEEDITNFYPNQRISIRNELSMNQIAREILNPIFYPAPDPQVLEYKTWWSKDRFIDEEEDTLLAEGTTESSWAIFSNIPDVADATYYVITQLDPAGNIGEINKENNTFTLEVNIKSDYDFVFGYEVDETNSPNNIEFLFPADLNKNDASPGAPLSVVLNVNNNTGLVFEELSFELYWSENGDSYDSEDIPLNDLQFPKTIKSENKYPISLTGSLQAPFELGNYHIICRVNYDSKYAETYQLNNEFSFPYSIVLPDLHLSVAGHPNEIHYNPFQREIWLKTTVYSPQGSIPSNDHKVDYLIGSTEDSDDALNLAYTRDNISDIVTCDVSPYAGTYFIFGNMDPDKTLPESDDDNNTVLIGEVDIYPPDLEIEFSECPTVVSVNSPTIISTGINETQFGYQGDVSVSYYLSIDDDWNTTGDNLYEFATTLISENVTDVELDLPNNISIGTYYLIGVVDGSNEIVELEDVINNKTLCQVTVAKPDLQVTLIGERQEVLTLHPNESETLTIVANDVNNNEIIASKIKYYLSVDENPSPSEEVGEIDIVTGEPQTITYYISDDYEDGPLNLLVQVDPDDNIGESDDENNITVFKIEVEEWREYLIQDASIPTTQIIPASNYTAALEVKETEIPASNDPIEVGLYLSLNEHHDNTDRLITSASIATNESSTLDFNIANDLGETYGGNYYLIFKADNQDERSERSEHNNYYSIRVSINGFDDDIVETDLNHITTTGFDEFENPISSSRSYFDLSGKLLQTQSKSYENNLISIAEPMYDRFDRNIGSTLSAPMNIDEFVFYPNFLVDNTNTPYEHKNFDFKDESNNKILNPDPVSSRYGTLGWYYSTDNNLEPYTPATEYPYNRNEFYDDGSGELKRSANVGDEFRNGKGHETYIKTFGVTNELDLEAGNLYLEVRNKLLNTNNTSLSGEAIQKLVIDGNKNQSLSFEDRSGNMLMGALPVDISESLLDIDITRAYDGSINYFYISSPEQTLTFVNTGSTTVQIFDVIRNESVYNGTNPVSISSLEPGIYQVTDLIGSLSYQLPLADISWNFYDNANRLIASISPNGVRDIVNNGVASYDKEDLPFTTYYKYNFQGWLLSSDEPDAGKTEYIYRKDGSIRYSQHANQRKRGNYSYTEYDALGRPIESGEYKFSYINDLEFGSPEMKATLESVGNQPWNVSARTQWVRTYYDLPASNIPTIRLDDSFDYTQHYIMGAVSYTENENSRTWYSYDEFGRVEWTIQEMKSGSTAKYVDVRYKYDYLGNVLESGVRVFSWNGVLQDQHFQYYDYDKDQRLSKVWTSYYPDLDINSETDMDRLTLRGSYSYYLHGPLKRIELGDGIQGTDFVYTIHGALKSINHPEAGKDPGADLDDAFAMLFDYYENDYKSAAYSYTPTNLHSKAEFNNQYTGNIAALSWTSAPVYSADDSFNRISSSNLFNYDRKSQLKTSTWASPVFSPGAYQYNVHAVEGKVVINAYDPNGNIMGLVRNDLDGNPLHNLNYNYTPETNQLDFIDDYKDYEYDDLGQLIREVSDTEERTIAYDVTGKVLRVHDGFKNFGEYKYDERGFRMYKTESIDETSTTWYIRDISGNLLMTYNREGADTKIDEIPVYGAGKLGTIYPRDNYSTAYEVTDHLGSVRALVKRKNTVYLATLENNLKATEEQLFDNYFETRFIKHDMNHTTANSIYDDYVSWLRSDRRIGPTKLLKVRPGDEVNMKAYVKYQLPLGQQGNPSSIGSLLSNVIAAFGGVNGGSVAEQGVYDAFNAADFGTGGLMATGEGDDFADVPKAYLQYLFFDKDMNFVYGGYDPMTSAAKVEFDDNDIPIVDAPHEELERHFTTEEEGYLFIYVANESSMTNVDIFFDDITIEHSATMVTQTTDYYAFGSIARRASTPNAYFEANGIETEGEDFGKYYSYGYQGQFSMEDMETGWNSFELRNYDSDIGRWLTTDPYRQYHSPYTGMGNNPTNNVDPDGGCATGDTPCIEAAKAAGFTNQSDINAFVNLDAYAPPMLSDGSMMNALNVPGVPINTTPGLDFDAAQNQAAFETAAVLYTMKELFMSQFQAGNHSDGSVSASSPPVPGGNVQTILKQIRIAKKALELSKRVGKNSVKIKTLDKIIHFDLVGATHKGVHTPHIQFSIKNVNPKGQVFFNKDTKFVRPMTDQDLRILENFLNQF